MGSFCLQGIGLQLSPAQAGTPAFKDSLTEVLSNPKYTKAAKAMSVKIRARKNTPVQEAAGADPIPWRHSLVCPCNALQAIAHSLMNELDIRARVMTQ